jgi:hypothetical protein
MPNVLLVTYPFPPSGTVGVPRALAYIRHLRSHGCHISVLTATKARDCTARNDYGIRTYSPEVHPFINRIDNLSFLSRGQQAIAPVESNGHGYRVESYAVARILINYIFLCSGRNLVRWIAHGRDDAYELCSVRRRSAWISLQECLVAQTVIHCEGSVALPKITGSNIGGRDTCVVRRIHGAAQVFVARRF